MISACNEYEKIMAPALKIKLADSSPNPVFDGEVEPSIPNKTDNDKTILGIDTNKNGIRDDIDIWINRTALDYNERMAMRQYAKDKQFWLKVCSEELVMDVKKAEDGVANSHTCLRSTSNYLRKEDNLIEKYINTITLNTSRRSCDNFYNKHSRVVTILNAGDGYLNCNFEIKNKHNFMKIYNNEKVKIE